MQNELSHISQENIEMLLNKLYPHLTNLMIDTYGNYFCQKLIKACSVKQRLKILESVRNCDKIQIYRDFSKISKNNSGTHSVQCLIEIISSAEEEEFVRKCVENDVLNLSFVNYIYFKSQDTNATHVVQKIVGMINEEKRELINKNLLLNLRELVLDQNGICVVS